MFNPTRILRQQVGAFSKLPHLNEVKMAYDLHQPAVSLQSNINNNNHENEPIIFIHGVFGNKKSYAQDCKLIADNTHTPVYTLDLRNHGETSHAAPFNYDVLTADIKAFCEEHSFEKVKLVGYSLGAKASMLTALKYPDLVKSAVVIDNAPINQPHLKGFMKSYIKSMKYILDESRIHKNDKEWKEKANSAMKKFLPNGNLRRNLLVNLVNKPPKNAEESTINFDTEYIQFLNPIHEMEQMIVDEVATWPDTKGLKYEGETHFIRGLKSPFITKEGEAAIMDHFPNADITDLNSNHDILDDRPGEYVKIICDFFNLHRYQNPPKDANVVNYKGYGFQQPIAEAT